MSRSPEEVVRGFLLHVPEYWIDVHHDTAGPEG
jgi:hypothetical protein